MIPTKPPPTLKHPENFSNEFADFISRCLVKNPEERPSATNLSHNKFIKSAKPVSVLKSLCEMALKMLEEEEEQEDSVSIVCGVCPLSQYFEAKCIIMVCNHWSFIVMCVCV